MANITVNLIEKEIPRLRRFARYLVRDADRADDVVQECLARALDKVDSWQPGTNLRAWLFVILRNCHIDEVRRARHHPVVNDAGADDRLAGIPESQALRVTLGEIRDAFLRLKEEHREILLLIVVEGLDYQEAAGILGIPVGTVRSRLSRARQALRSAAATRPVRPATSVQIPRGL
jgi:RNA polymerase sigma-70 factor (ECF subfamily)